MGMYFEVRKDKDEKCPYCDAELTENYQSKNSIGNKHDEWGGCCERHPKSLPLLEKNEVENFYLSCKNCSKWIEYKNEFITRLINEYN